MKTNHFIPVLSFCALLFSSCTEKGVDTSVPAVVFEKIEAFALGNTVCKSTAKVTEFTFQGKDVYQLFPGTCHPDLGSDVLNDKGEVICHVGGFIKGGEQCNGVDFLQNAKLKKVVWQN